MKTCIHKLVHSGTIAFAGKSSLKKHKSIHVIDAISDQFRDFSQLVGLLYTYGSCQTNIVREDSLGICSCTRNMSGLRVEVRLFVHVTGQNKDLIMVGEVAFPLD